jgi:hypothetical protein
MSEFQVTITMATATVSALITSGCLLDAFRAVQNSDLAGRPLLWQQPPYSATTQIGWDDGYAAYTSESPIQNGTPVSVGFSAPVTVGQQLEVTTGGIGQVTAGGYPDAISILNTTTTPYTCGIGGGVGDAPAPYCAFPLYGKTLQVITPLQQILLLFSTAPITPGTVVSTLGAPQSAALTTAGPGILIDLDTANQRTVNYDINTGWSWGGYSWAQEILAGTDLEPLLIQPD